MDFFTSLLLSRFIVLFISHGINAVPVPAKIFHVRNPQQSIGKKYFFSLLEGEDVPPTLSSEVEIARGYSEDDVDSPWLPLISDHEQEPSIDIPEENDDSISETKIPTSIWKGVGEEVPKHYKKPRVKSYHKMIKLLGGEENLEPEFMSVEKPKDVVEKKDEAETQASFTSQERLLLTALKDLRLARKLRSLASDLVQRDASQTEVIELTKAWLEDELTCKITKNWKDLGQFFWPRWIYQGHCDTSSSTCTGAKTHSCQTSETKTVHLLYWHCRRRRRNNDLQKRAISNSAKAYNLDRSTRKHKFRRCRWIRVPFPITTSCKCTC